jgi:hypothetical protein
MYFTSNNWLAVIRYFKILSYEISFWNAVTQYLSFLSKLTFGNTIFYDNSVTSFGRDFVDSFIRTLKAQFKFNNIFPWNIFYSHVGQFQTNKHTKMQTDKQTNRKKLFQSLSSKVSWFKVVLCSLAVHVNRQLLWRNINQVITKMISSFLSLEILFQAQLRLKHILFRNTWFKVLSDIFNWNAFFQNCFWLFRFSIQNMPIQNLSISDSVYIFVLFCCAQNIGKHLVWAESQSLQPTIHVLTSRQRVEGKARTESDRFPLLFSDSHLFLIHPILVCRVDTLANIKGSIAWKMRIAC